MKKILFPVLFSISFFISNAQVRDSINVKTSLVIGFGGQFQSDLNINSKLANAGLPTVPTSVPEFIIGLGFVGEKFSGGFEANSVYFNSSNGANNTNFASVNIRNNFSYNFINKQKTMLAAGLNLTFSFSQFNIYNSGTVINMNNLNPSGNTGLINLRNSMIYIGPSASLFLFKNTKWMVRLNAAYEFGIARGSWKSDFANITNTVNERGNNRFVVGLVLY
jgi:hypothetical protein